MKQTRVSRTHNDEWKLNLIKSFYVELCCICLMPIQSNSINCWLIETRTQSFKKKQRTYFLLQWFNDHELKLKFFDYVTRIIVEGSNAMDVLLYGVRVYVYCTAYTLKIEKNLWWNDGLLCLFVSVLAKIHYVQFICE